MEILSFLLHLDEHLANIIQAVGPWSYVLLFLVIFTETGLVIMPFLPGDSLLFVVGTLAGSGLGLNIWIVYLTMLAAAIIGDSVNYWIGNRLGEKVFTKENSRIFNKAYLQKTQRFYEKHGGKTIILARFVPIVRTFAPFVAGVGKMKYSTFFFYNIVGGFIWVTSLTFLGYFFGGLPFFKENFEYAVIGIILVSLLPMVYEYINHKRMSSKNSKTSLKEIKQTIKKAQ